MEGITPEQKHIEMSNHKGVVEELQSEFNERLSEKSIKIYTQHSENDEPRLSRELRLVKSVSVDETGTGGSVGLNFENDYISVRPQDGLSASGLFKQDFYKLTSDSYHTILDMMNDLIKQSGYSDSEKDKMFNFVVNGLKNMITEKVQEDN